jgi:hypothetical protein
MASQQGGFSGNVRHLPKANIAASRRTTSAENTTHALPTVPVVTLSAALKGMKCYLQETIEDVEENLVWFANRPPITYGKKNNLLVFFSLYTTLVLGVSNYFFSI